MTRSAVTTDSRFADLMELARSSLPAFSPQVRSAETPFCDNHNFLFLSLWSVVVEIRHFRPSPQGGKTLDAWLQEPYFLVHHRSDYHSSNRTYGERALCSRLPSPVNTHLYLSPSPSIVMAGYGQHHQRVCQAGGAPGGGLHARLHRGGA
jgi:hypothetical protein